MGILDEAIQAEQEEAQAADLGGGIPEQDAGGAMPGVSLPQIDFSFLKTPTGSGSIDDYVEHVLNPNKSRGIAQMLRGFTGLAGELNLAILDITFGAFAFLKETKKSTSAVKEDTTPLYEKPIINP